MKKGKVFTKSQAVLALMVLCLGAAVWLNMKFSSNEKYLGEATYVSSSSGEKSETVSTSAKPLEDDADYFKSAKQKREQALKASTPIRIMFPSPPSMAARFISWPAWVQKVTVSTPTAIWSSTAAP